MTQDEASSNFRESVIAFDVGFRKVRRKRCIERQFALIQELASCSLMCLRKLFRERPDYLLRFAGLRVHACKRARSSRCSE